MLLLLSMVSMNKSSSATFHGELSRCRPGDCCVQLAEGLEQSLYCAECVPVGVSQLTSSALECHTPAVLKSLKCLCHRTFVQLVIPVRSHRPRGSSDISNGSESLYNQWYLWFPQFVTSLSHLVAVFELWWMNHHHVRTLVYYQSLVAKNSNLTSFNVNSKLYLNALCLRPITCFTLSTSIGN